MYTYDYGDSWEIEVLKTDSKTPLDSSVPLCIAGEGDNPPEDVGGEPVFMLLAAAWAGGSGEDEWDGDLEGWEKELFDLERANRRLGRRASRP